MGIIKCLDSNLMNMIAAGEVVERPSGVVKELVDNSIDAKANKINIEIKNGGIDLIKISDNGIGMSYEDSLLAFERHATSKIKELKDLWSINSLGFRGEALPSIAAVSNVKLKTNDGSESSLVEIDFGTLKKHDVVASNKGTTIEVKKLFQKVPARLKYLKSPNYEFALISDVVNKFCLAYPNIAFKLIHNDKVILQTNGNGNLLQVIMELMGRDIAKNSIEINFEDDDYQIEGFIVQPNITRSNNGYMNIFVNNRMIKSYKINKIIKEAYKEYIPNDRYPICFFNISMDPRLVDVNVHPSKWEVKFSKEKQLLTTIEQGIKKALKNYFNPQQVIVKESIKEKVKNNIDIQTINFTEYKQETNYVYNKNDSNIKEETNKGSFNDFVKNENEIIVNDKVENKIVNQTSDNEITPVEKVNEDSKELRLDEPVVSKKRILDNLSIIGQLNKAYILAEGVNGLVIIDQHAAQERYHFELIEKSIKNQEVKKQTLLIPLQINVNNKIIAIFEEKIKPLLNDIGFIVDIFSENSLLIREVPIWYEYVEEKAFIIDLLDLFLEKEAINVTDLRRHAIATAACHSSIRFNRILSKEEMEKVIEDLKQCEQPFSCPHGRPTLIEYTLKDLEKSFLRIK